MKEIRTVCLCMALLILLQPFSTAHAFAGQTETEQLRLVAQTTERVSEDLLLDIFVYEEVTAARGTAFQQNGTKTVVGRKNDGTELWSFTVSGTFAVNQGVSAVCTSAVSSYEIYDSNWHFNGATCRTSGNQAIGDAEFIKKLLGIKVETETCHVVLTCDSNGNLS